MNGFLLMLRHTLDDCPIGLYKTREEAINSLSNRVGYVLSEDDPKGYPCGPWALSKEERGALLIVCFTPRNFSIVEFKNGVPVELSIVAEYENSVDDQIVAFC